MSFRNVDANMGRNKQKVLHMSGELDMSQVTAVQAF